MESSTAVILCLAINLVSALLFFTSSSQMNLNIRPIFIKFSRITGSIIFISSYWITAPSLGAMPAIATMILCWMFAATSLPYCYLLYKKGRAA